MNTVGSVSLRLALENFINQLANQRGLSYHTLRGYRADLEHFIGYAVERDVNNVQQASYQFMRRYLSSLIDAGYSSATMSRKTVALRRFFAFQQEEGIIDSNPLKLLASRRKKMQLPRYFTIETMNKLLALPDASSKEGLRDRIIMELLYAGGMRVSELTSLTMADTDLTSQRIRVKGKGNKERMVPLHEIAVSKLREYLLANPPANISEPLIKGKNGKAISTDTVRRITKKYLRQLGTAYGYSPHSFRHSFATHLLENGADIRVVQELLGHADLGSTQIYTHLSKNHLKKVFNQSHPRA